MKWFVRTENVSLKCGQHGIGPYTNMNQVIESLVTCIASHTPKFFEEEKITLYFIPWVELNPSSEYRVFIHEGMMTSISQQHLYHVYPEYDRTNDVQLIYNYFHNHIRPIIPQSSYSIDIDIDIAILDPTVTNNNIIESNDSRVYFIEINGFGKEYAAGSSLFGWIQDEDILYGRKSNILPDDQNNLIIVDMNDIIPVSYSNSNGENILQEYIYLRYTIRS